MPLPQKIIEGLTTKADKIRALDKAGFERTEIARFLGISYQHVRNTVVRGQPRNRKAIAVSRPTVEPWHIDRLITSGFEVIGDCAITGDQAFGYSAQAPSEAGVYAFAVDGFVMYVGLTRLGLRTRLGHYIRGHEAQKTSAHVKRLILEALGSGSHVQVLVAKPHNLEWNGLPVDGAAGLETGLIRLLKPTWNRQGNK